MHDSSIALAYKNKNGRMKNEKLLKKSNND